MARRAGGVSQILKSEIILHPNRRLRRRRIWPRPPAGGAGARFAFLFIHFAHGSPISNPQIRIYLMWHSRPRLCRPRKFIPAKAGVHLVHVIPGLTRNPVSHPLCPTCPTCLPSNVVVGGLTRPTRPIFYNCPALFSFNLIFPFANLQFSRSSRMKLKSIDNSQAKAFPTQHI